MRKGWILARKELLYIYHITATYIWMVFNHETYARFTLHNDKCVCGARVLVYLWWQLITNGIDPSLMYVRAIWRFPLARLLFFFLSIIISIQCKRMNHHLLYL